MKQRLPSLAVKASPYLLLKNEFLEETELAFIFLCLHNLTAATSPIQTSFDAQLLGLLPSPLHAPTDIHRLGHESQKIRSK